MHSSAVHSRPSENASAKMAWSSFSTADDGDDGDDGDGEACSPAGDGEAPFSSSCSGAAFFAAARLRGGIAVDALTICLYMYEHAWEAALSRWSFQIWARLEARVPKISKAKRGSQRCIDPTSDGRVSRNRHRLPEPRDDLVRRGYVVVHSFNRTRIRFSLSLSLSHSSSSSAPSASTTRSASRGRGSRVSARRRGAGRHRRIRAGRVGRARRGPAATAVLLLASAPELPARRVSRCR